MQFIDLQAQYRRIQDNVNKRIRNVLDHGRYIMGPEIRELEDKLAEFAGCRYCLTCSSGTDALLLALMAYDIGPGDAIFTSPFTFIATAEVIALLGATPVFVDIDEQTLNIDTGKLAAAISDVTHGTMPTATMQQSLTPRGIIGVDIFGLTADYDEINRIARQNSLFVVEDAAQSFGATCKGVRACNLTDIAATSFFPAKPLGCYGDGGAVFTDDHALYETVESLRIHGKGSDKYDNARIGINGRCDTLQAAVLLEKLAIFPDEIQLRQAVAQRYDEGLQHAFDLQHIPRDCQSVRAQYAIIADDRSRHLARLKDAGIPTAIYYPKPLHVQTAFASLGYQRGDLPVCEKIADHIFSTPMHPYLDEEQQSAIVKILAG
ncbi:MAG: aminotransferase class I/II-fold pyridoxal phosphate-dependent enzyme [Chitinivibrionales bacterium]|nr:aminotransferase class I/II-fold pyridoxal phosphate-dependent enzyme [Chitinivibrionales bacterium]